MRKFICLLVTTLQNNDPFGPSLRKTAIKIRRDALRSEELEDLPDNILWQKLNDFLPENARGPVLEVQRISDIVIDEKKTACVDCLGIGVVGNMNAGEMTGCAPCKGAGYVEAI